MVFVYVGRYDREARILRLLRVCWDRKGGPGKGVGWSSKFTVALQPKLLQWRREYGHLIVVLFGIRLHYARSWGGRYAD